MHIRLGKSQPDSELGTSCNKDGRQALPQPTENGCSTCMKSSPCDFVYLLFDPHVSSSFVQILIANFYGAGLPKLGRIRHFIDAKFS